jgi:S1-C subfamily serine protease
MRVEAEPGGTAAAANARPDRLAGATFQDASGNVFVEAVEPNSPAALAGIRPGDVVAAVNRQPVKSVSDLRRVLSEARGTVALDLFRGGGRLLLVIR